MKPSTLFFLCIGFLTGFLAGWALGIDRKPTEPPVQRIELSIKALK